MKAWEWELCVETMLQTVQYQDDFESVVAETCEQLMDYIGSMKPTAEEWTRAIQLDMPFIRDGALYFRRKHFTAFLASGLVFPDKKDLAVALAQLGYQRSNVSCRAGGKVIGRSYYRGPTLDQLQEMRRDLAGEEPERIEDEAEDATSNVVPL